MARILEGVFVIGCSLVGFGMNTPQGNVFEHSIECSVQLVSLAHDKIAMNGSRVSEDLMRIPVDIISHVHIL